MGSLLTMNEQIPPVIPSPPGQNVWLEIKIVFTNSAPSWRQSTLKTVKLNLNPKALRIHNCFCFKMDTTYSFIIFSFVVYLFVCQGTHTSHVAWMEIRTIWKSPSTQWVLGIELWSPEEAVAVLNQRTLDPVFKIRLSFYICKPCCCVFANSN